MMKLCSITEATWWNQLKRQTPTDERPSRSVPPRKRALKYTPPTDVSKTIQHSDKPGDTTTIRPVVRRFNPEKAMQTILAYIKRYPEAKRDIVMVIQDEERRKSQEAQTTESTSFKYFLQLIESINPDDLAKITKAVQMLTLEQLRQLLIAI